MQMLKEEGEEDEESYDIRVFFNSPPFRQCTRGHTYTCSGQKSTEINVKFMFSMDAIIKPCM